jgi:hypothetical protein
VENEQIEAISNRPPWVAAVLEVGMSDGSPESLRAGLATPAFRAPGCGSVPAS